MFKKANRKFPLFAPSSRAKSVIRWWMALLFMLSTVHAMADSKVAVKLYVPPNSDGAYMRGVAKGSILTVEWYEAQDNSATWVRNDDCSFTVDATGDSAAAASLSGASTPEYAFTSGLHRWRVVSGCGPEKVGKENSYLHVSAFVVDEDADDSYTPTLLGEFTIHGTGSTEKNRSAYYLKDFVGSTEGGEGWGIHTGCGYGEPIDGYDLAHYNLDLTADDENTESDGVLIFPQRDVQLADSGLFFKGAVTICDSGYLADPDQYFPANEADYLQAIELWPHSDPELVEFGINTHNRDGFGLENLAVSELDYDALESDVDSLRILTYNVASIPSGPLKGAVSERTKRLKEISDHINALPAEAQPDILVFQEVFQGEFSGFGLDNWGDNAVKNDGLRDRLSGYTKLDIYPISPDVGFNNNPLACKSGGSSQTGEYYCDGITPPASSSLYPDCSSTVSRSVCTNARGNSVDSGVYIMAKSSNTQVMDDDFELFEYSRGVDKGASKGVRYAKIRKCATGCSSYEDYHIFGTHLQSSANDCQARVQQVATIADFIQSKNLTSSDRLILTGDLNIDLAGNNHIDGSGSEKEQVCRNELEYLTNKLTAVAGLDVREVYPSELSMPYSNDCLVNSWVGRGYREQCPYATTPGKKSKQLDHTLTMGELPVRSGATTVRLVSHGTHWSNHVGEDLSDHNPVISLLSYNSATTSSVPHEFYSRRQDHPTYCPYGILSTDAQTCCKVGTDCTATATINEIQQSFEYCNEDYAVAPCIVTPGYQNIMKLDGVTVAATGSYGASWPADRVMDGIFQYSGGGSAAGDIWLGGWQTPETLTVTFPLAQNVKRIRFRNGVAGGYWGVNEYDINVRDTLSGAWETVVSGAVTANESGKTIKDPDVWHTHEIEPRFVKEIEIECLSFNHNGCGIAELEVYGGAEIGSSVNLGSYLTATASSSSLSFGVENAVNGTTYFGGDYADSAGNVWLASGSDPETMTLTASTDLVVEKIRLKNAVLVDGSAKFAGTILYRIDSSLNGVSTENVGYTAMDTDAPDTWYVHTFPAGITLDSLTFTCGSAEANTCALDEIELYGYPL